MKLTAATSTAAIVTFRSGVIRRGDVVAKRVTCVCGYTFEAETDDDLWALAQQHMGTDHPDLVGKVAREDIIAQAEMI
jgi:hypothetical protein